MWDAHETSTQGRALLVERSGGGGGLVKDVVISDGRFDHEACVGDDGFFAASDVGHDERRKERALSGERTKRRGKYSGWTARCVSAVCGRIGGKLVHIPSIDNTFSDSDSQVDVHKQDTTLPSIVPTRWWRPK